MSSLYDLSDEELEAQFRAAKAEMEADPGEEFAGQDDTVDDEIEYVDEQDDLEQPEEDSDDDASTDEETEEEVEDDSETEEDDHDGDTDKEEEQTDEAEEEVTKEVQPVQKRKYKANGKEYEFTDDEIFSQFGKVFAQAADYTKKTQALSKYRKTIDIIEQTGISNDDLNLMADVLKGDKGAIAEVLKRTKVDTLELDTEEHRYTPKDYGRDENALAIKDVIDEISADKEYEITNRVLGKEWDDNSWIEMSKNPEMIKLLHMDVKSGMYDKVQPIAEKLKVYGGNRKSDLEYYKEAAGIYFGQMEQEQARQAETERANTLQAEREAEKARIAAVKEKENKAKAVKQEAVKRKAAAPTRKAAGTKKNTNYLDESDEAFEEWYRKLEERM